MSSSKKKEKSKKSRKLFGKHKKKDRKTLSPRESSSQGNYTTPFDDFEDSLASSSEFEDVSSPRPALSTSSRSQSSDEPIARRNSVGGHRPVKETRISTHQVAKPEISNNQFQKTDEPVFTRGHVRTRSATLSTPNPPNFLHSESDEEDDRAQSPRRLTERSKTKMFTPKTVFFEQENRLEEINTRIKVLQQAMKDMETHMNELSSVNRAMYHRVVTLMSMLSEISRGAEYYMKDSKSLPYSVLKPHDQRPPKKGVFSCCSESPQGYEMLSEDAPEEENPDDNESGWLCFSG